MIVDWRRGRLHQEDIFEAHRVEKLHSNVTVWISIHNTSARPGTELTRNCCSQCRVRSAAENDEVILQGGPSANALIVHRGTLRWGMWAATTMPTRLHAP
jgi:hypothetical protein